MSPNVAKKDKGTLPKTEVVPGTLAFYGANQYTLSQLAQNKCTNLIGLKDARLSETLKATAQLKLASTNVDITGKCFNGLSDALYRGTFPHVIIVSCDVLELDRFMDDILDHIEKMVSVGFFFQFPTPAESLIPNIIITCNGIYFEALQKKLSLMMDGLKTLDKATKTAVFNKFMRGIFSDYSVVSPYQSGNALPKYKPAILKIAGGSPANKKAIKTALESHKLPIIMADENNNSIDALELENALKRVTQTVLPALKSNSTLKAKEAETLEKELQNAILDIGQHRKSFHDQYGFDFLQEEPQNGSSLLSPGDLSTLRALAHYAKVANMPQIVTKFDTLAKQVQALLEA